MQVDARRQPLFHELTSERLSTVVVGHGGQDDDDLGHGLTITRFACCTFRRLVVPFFPWTKTNSRRRRRGGPRSGRTGTGGCCRPPRLWSRWSWSPTAWSVTEACPPCCAPATSMSS